MRLTAEAPRQPLDRSAEYMYCLARQSDMPYEFSCAPQSRVDQLGLAWQHVCVTSGTAPGRYAKI